MSKLNELRRTAGQNVKDSAGADRVDQPAGNAVVGRRNAGEGSSGVGTWP